MHNQSLPNPGTVTAFGSYVVRTDPDHAVVDCQVTHLADMPADAFAETKRTVTQVRAFLQSAKVESADVASARTTLELATVGYGESYRVLGHRTKLGLSITIRDLDSLEQVLVGLVEAGADSISGVQFYSSRLAELRALARTGAVDAARAKAKLYAEAAGVGLGKVLHIEDVNPDLLSRRQRGHGANADVGNLDFEAGSGAAGAGALMVNAGVMLAFSIVHH